MKEQLKEIVVFVMLCLVIGIPIKLYYQYGQTNLASTTTESQDPNSFLQVMAEFIGVAKHPSQIGNIDVPKSNCLFCLSKEKTEEIQIAPAQFETIESCGGTAIKDPKTGAIDYKGDRVYFEDLLSTLPPQFRTKRNSYPKNQIPVQCISFALDDWTESTKLSDRFASCFHPYGEPESGKKKACKTENYVYSIYNSLMDVSDCLNIDTKYLTPKLFNESGFHINALSKTGAAGTGQLTADAISDSNKRLSTTQSTIQSRSLQSGTDLTTAGVNQNVIEVVNGEMSKVIEEVSKSQNKSCQNILKYDEFLQTQKYNSIGNQTKSSKTYPYSGLFKPIKPDFKVRCSIMRPPENPMKNILYTAIYTKFIREYIPERMKEKKIDPLIQSAGLDLSAKNRAELEKMISLLSYNAGIGQAPNLLASYLSKYIRLRDETKKSNSTANKKYKRLVPRLTIKEFDFSTPLSDDLELALSPLLTEAEAKSIKKLKSSYITNPASLKDPLDKMLTALALKYKKQLNETQFIPFGIHVLINQGIGESDYLYSLRSRANALNQSKMLGSNVCTYKDYLEL